MELKVWVDGVQRVVCGVTEKTSCQDVVIALAQAIGQTGRYVLIQTLRDKERQLLPHERPLEFLAKSGQYANDVHFVLKRTGPSLAERPSSDSAPLPPERTFVRSSLPLTPRALATEVTRAKEPKKSLTFNLGSTSSNDILLKHRQKHQTGAAGKDAAHRPPTKEDIFKLVLQQQEQLRALEMQNCSIGKDLQTWERGRAGGPHEEDDEIAYLGRLICRNDAELAEEMFWLDELEREGKDEQKRQDKMRQLRATMEDYTLKMKGLSEKTEDLEQEIQKENSKRLSGVPSPADIEEMVAKMRKELEAKTVQSQEMESNLSNVERACEEARRNLETRNQELEELNKDLRQCNLQQFILQTGSTVPSGQGRLDEECLSDQPSSPLDGAHRSRGRTDSLPRSAGNPLMGPPCTLQNALLSARSPEVLPSRETSWT